MRRQALRVLSLGSLIWISLPILSLYAQQEYHGADSVFEKEGMVILWAVLKGPDEERSWVYIKIVLTEGNSSPFELFSVEAMDPFSKEKEWLIRGEKLKKEQVLKSPRSSFRDKTGRRILFYRDPEELRSERPTVVVFYLSLPDTSPELLTEREVEDYFGIALSRLKRR